MQYNPECMHYLPCLISASYEIVMHLSFLITEFFQVLIIGFFSQRSFLFYTGNNISTLCKVRKILKVIRKRGKMPASSIGLPFWALVRPGRLIWVYGGYAWELNLSTRSEMGWDVYMCASFLLWGKMQQNNSNSSSRSSNNSDWGFYNAGF